MGGSCKTMRPLVCFAMLVPQLPLRLLTKRHEFVSWAALLAARAFPSMAGQRPQSLSICKANRCLIWGG